MRGQWGGGFEVKPWKCTINFRLGVSRCVTGFHLRATALAFPTPAQVAAAVNDFAVTNFRTLLTSADEVLGVDVVNMVTGEGASTNLANQPGTLGVAAAGILPSYVMAPISLKGELRRRYGQGRMYWPIRNEVWVDGDALNATGTAAVEGVLDSFNDRFIDTTVVDRLAAINVHGVLPPLAATPSRPAREEIPASWYDVTSARLNTTLSFLRSRKAGVGT